MKIDCAPFIVGMGSLVRLNWLWRLREKALFGHGGPPIGLKTSTWKVLQYLNCSASAQIKKLKF